MPHRSLDHRGAGVVFHEIVHLMQNETDQSSLQEAFDRQGCSQAGIEINEAIATILGNYLYRLRTEGNPPEGTLYSDPYVEDYARGLLPLVQSYLEARRALDEEFVEQAVTLYEQAYPERFSDPAYVFRHLMMVGPDGALAPPSLVGRLTACGLMRSVGRHFPYDVAARTKIDRTTRTVLYLTTPDRLNELSEVLPAEAIEALSSGGVWASREPSRWVFVEASDNPERRYEQLWWLVTSDSLSEGVLRERSSPGGR